MIESSYKEPAPGFRNGLGGSLILCPLEDYREE